MNFSSTDCATSPTFLDRSHARTIILQKSSPPLQKSPALRSPLTGIFKKRFTAFINPQNLSHVQVPVILLKKPSIFREINLSSNFSYWYFYEKAHTFYHNQPAVQPSLFRKICKGNLKFLMKSTCYLGPLLAIFLEELLDFN